LLQTVWDNLKRRTVEKADKAAQNGARGDVLTHAKNLVLNAIGKEKRANMQTQWFSQVCQNVI
jgi:hypothetical protein